MANQYVNKVIIGKEVKLDLTADSVTPDKLAKGITAHDKTGAPITGTNTKDVDSSDAPPPWPRCWRARPPTPAVPS